MNRSLTHCVASVLVCALVHSPLALAQITQIALPASTATSPPRQVFDREQLDQMLAPMALYPDALVSQMLRAKAAAHSLESAAGRTGGEAKAGVSAARDHTRSLGNRLVSGAIWAGDEAARAFKKLGNAVGALDRTARHRQKALPART
ncbi:MAG: hypothetical protein JWO70_434 [Betaproteobacteria bacterium]|jgi:hypothetical protein|nr:hypothetical protein [Betaproteobacteria bacterium]